MQSESVLTGIMPYSANTPSARRSPFAWLWAAPAIPPRTPGAGQLFFLAVQTGHVDRHVGQFAVRSVGELPDQLGRRSTMRPDSSYLKTYNATPSFAYRINDMISVGVGVQIQYAKADLSHCIPRALRCWCAARRIVGPRLGLWLHRRRHPDADADHHHRCRLSLGDQSEDRRHAATGGDLAGSSRRRAPRSICPTRVSVGLRQRVTPQWTVLGHGRVDELEPHRHVGRTPTAAGPWLDHHSVRV